MCTPTSSTSSSQRRRIAAVISVLIFIAVLHSSGVAGLLSKIHGYNAQKWMNNTIKNIISSPHRKLMTPKRSVEKPARFWGDAACTEHDIIVRQGPGAPLPSGIPTYTVEIVNACATGCNISDIHIHCGWFSSARIINPHIFKRIGFNDCLVYGGRPLQNGQIILFQYANTHSYPLAISALSCV